MDTEICTIDISNNWLTDIYTFYEDGKIKRIFDNNSLSRDIVEWLEPNEINKNSKDRLIKNCPEKCKEKVMAILDYP